MKCRIMRRHLTGSSLLQKYPFWGLWSSNGNGMAQKSMVWTLDRSCACSYVGWALAADNGGPKLQMDSAVKKSFHLLPTELTVDFDT